MSRRQAAAAAASAAALPLPPASAAAYALDGRSSAAGIGHVHSSHPHVLAGPTFHYAASLLCSDPGCGRRVLFKRGDSAAPLRRGLFYCWRAQPDLVCPSRRDVEAQEAAEDAAAAEAARSIAPGRLGSPGPGGSSPDSGLGSFCSFASRANYVAPPPPSPSTATVFVASYGGGRYAPRHRTASTLPRRLVNGGFEDEHDGSNGRLPHTKWKQKRKMARTGAAAKKGASHKRKQTGGQSRKKRLPIHANKKVQKKRKQKQIAPLKLPRHHQQQQQLQKAPEPEPPQEPQWFFPGDLVLAQFGREGKASYPAWILEVSADGTQGKVRYDGLTSAWDEWRPLSSLMSMDRAGPRRRRPPQTTHY